MIIELLIGMGIFALMTFAFRFYVDYEYQKWFGEEE